MANLPLVDTVHHALQAWCIFAGFALTHRDNDDRRDAIVLRLPKSSLLHLFRARAVADLLFAKAAERCSFRNAWIGSFERHSFLP